MNLILNKITMKYGKKIALSDFTCQFSEGVYGLIGPNGAGKTTLLQILAGVTMPTYGKVIMNGLEIKTHQVEYVKNIGYLPQEIAMYPYFTVYEMMDYMACLKGMKNGVKEKILELLNLVNLQEKGTIQCKKLSGGMKRRLGIALSLINDPQILILDEPTTGVDITERIKFRNIISTLAKNRIIIYSTHTVNDIGMIAKEMIFLEKGMIIKQGMGKDLISFMEGRVWESDLTIPEYKEFVENFGTAHITNIFFCNRGYRIRSVSDKKQLENSFNVAPTYEDLSVYIFIKTDNGRKLEKSGF